MDIGCRSTKDGFQGPGRELYPSLSNNGLKGKTALVASHRSGKCIPSELVQILLYEGATVYAIDTNQKIVDILVNEADKFVGKTPHGRTIDGFDGDSVEQVVRDVEEEAGGIDILATDFGLLDFMHHLKPFRHQSKEDWDAQYRDILEATLLWTKAVVPGMIQRNFGRVIHMISDTARIGAPKMSIYGAFKAAVSAFSRSLAQELARYRITVNCVSLGIQEIDELKDPTEEAVVKLDKTLKRVPLRRYSEPEEPAAMIAYLASDLGAYITGQTISVSGGLVMT